jgi:hypothetical protein
MAWQRLQQRPQPLGFHPAGRVITPASMVAQTISYASQCSGDRPNQNWNRPSGHKTLDYASFLAGMRLSPTLRIGVLIAAICLCAQGQNAPSQGAPEGKGMPPRATPADYQAHAQAGAVTVAAEFDGHSIPTLQGTTLSAQEYVVVETGLFGPPGARIRLSIDDFALRINGKKMPLPSQPYGLVVKSVKDPEWEPPEVAESKESKSKTSLSSGGDDAQVQKGEPKPSPTPVKIPVEVQRAWAQRVQRVTLPEGDRALPQAGLIFFEYRGKTEKIHSIELIYTGPAGKATLTLQP